MGRRAATVVTRARRGTVRRAAIVLSTVGAFASVGATRVVAPAATEHPLHTSFAEVAYDPAAQLVTVSLRVFADDVSADVARRIGVRAGPDGVPSDGAVFRYVATRFTVVSARGEALAFRWCGARRVGVQLFVCLRAPAAAPLAGARVRSTILTDAFADQVNIVQVTYDGRRKTLLFTRGDGAKVL